MNDTFFDHQIFIDAIGEGARDIIANLVLHEEVGSTSTDLIERLASGEPVGTVVIAARQTGGRGRSGNRWHSTHPHNLYISCGVAVAGQIAARLPLVPLAAGVAAFEALAGEGVEDIRLKWPNDLLRNDRKIGGILCETPGIENDSAIAVVGMGINIGAQTFPDELAHIADFVPLENSVGGASGFRERVAANWVRRLHRWCEVILNDDHARLMERWKQCGEPFGRRVQVGDVVGRTVDLTAEGRLLVQTDTGEICTIPGGMVQHLD